MRQHLRPLAAACAVALALGASACGGDDEDSGGDDAAAKASAPGITATQVTVGGHFPLTGPAAAGYSDIPPAIDAMFKHVNANGGVNGRKLRFIARDDGYNPTNTVRVTRQLVLQDKVFAILGGLGTPTHSKVTGFLNASRVPDLFASSGCQCWDKPKEQPYTFGWLPEYTVEGKILGSEIKKRFAGKKVGVLFQDDDFGADGMAGLDKYIKDQIVSRQGYQPGGTDIGPQMAALRAAKADVVVLLTIPTYTALAHLAALQLNFKPQFVASSVGSDPVTLDGLLSTFSKGKAGASIAEGLITDFYLPSVADASNGWTKLFKEIHAKYIGKEAPFSATVAYGMAVGYTFAQALEKAGANPTRQDIVKAIEAGGFRGPELAPFRYSAESHAGITGLQMGTLKSGKLELAGPVLTTDDGDEPVEESTEAPVTPPTSGWNVAAE